MRFVCSKQCNLLSTQLQHNIELAYHSQSKALDDLHYDALAHVVQHIMDGYYACDDIISMLLTIYDEIQRTCTNICNKISLAFKNILESTF